MHTMANMPGKHGGRRALCALLAIALCFLLASCKQAEKAPERTRVSVIYYNTFPSFEKLVEETYPDIDFHCEIMPYTGEELRRLKNGEGPNLIIVTQAKNDEFNEYFLDLSDSWVSTAYDATIIKQTKIDGKTYALPLPGQYWGYIVNETLYEQAGIPLPESNAELLDSLSKLQEMGLGTGDDNFNFGLQCDFNSDLAMFYIGAMVPDFLGTMEGVAWTADYENKQATMTGSWEKSFELSDALVESGLLDSAAVGRQRNQIRAKDRMASGKLAMTFGKSSLYGQIVDKNAELVEAGEAEEYSYRMLPLFSEEGGESWLMFSPAGFIGINRDASEAEQDACRRILELLSSAEGQSAVCDDLQMGASSLRDYQADEAYIPEGTKELIEDGYVYNVSLPGYVSEYLGSCVQKVMAGKMDVATALAAVDSYYYEGSAAVDSDLTVVGKVDCDMPLVDFNVRLGEVALGNFVADCVAQAADAPLAVVNGGGIRGSLFRGEVLGEDLAAVCPYDNLIVVLEVSGQTIWDMLENGVSKCTDDYPAGRYLQVSGFKYTYDSSKPVGSRIVSVSLFDGSEIDPEGRYQLAVNNYMAGSQGYAEGNGDEYTMLNYYDEATPKGDVKLIKETELTYRDALRIYFEKHQGLASAQVEGRIVDVSKADEA